MSYNTFEDMPVWKNAMKLAADIFSLTERLPKKEDFGLTSQMRRSALSVSGNIAEGFGRKHTKDKLNFYYDARGSLSETKNHLIYGNRVGYFKDDEFDGIYQNVEVVWKELNRLIASMQIRA
jgi:four helix bundle protein